MSENDPRLFVRHERPDPLHARVWFDAIDDPRLKTKAHLTLYVALCRIADFRAHEVYTVEGERTGRRAHSVPFANQSRRSFLMKKARIGDKETFYSCMRDLIAAGWVRRDYLHDMPIPPGYKETFGSQQLNNRPPVYTLLRPPDPSKATRRH